MAPDPLRIFIGTDETQLVAHQVLAYSIRKSATVDVDIVAMRDLRLPVPRHPANRPRARFSFYRFAIPELCGFRGRALYLDADMLVFGDVAELATMPFGPLGDKAVLCTSQAAPPEVWRDNPEFRPGRHVGVMLLDCGRLRWDAAEIIGGLDRGEYTYRELVHELCIVDPAAIADTLPATWNHLERYEPGTTKLLHYTVAPLQPWKNDDNPLAGLWMDWYREAVAAGAVDESDVRAMVSAGRAKPALLSAFGARRGPGRRLLQARAVRRRASAGRR